MKKISNRILILVMCSILIFAGMFSAIAIAADKKITELTELTTPVDADVLVIVDDPAGSPVTKKLTWANNKATLKTYFDTLYNLYVHPNHSGDVTSVADGAQTITAKAVTLSKMDDMATASLIGRNTAGVGVPEVLSKATALSLLNVADGADVTGSNAPQAHKDSHDPEDGSDALDTAAAAEIASVQAAAVGTSHSFARADHAHQIQHGITDNHLLTIDDADAADDDFAKLTANGIEGRSYAEVLSDIGAAASGANADITSTTALTQITRATGGAFDIAIGGVAGDDFTVDTDKFVVPGDTGIVKVGTAFDTPEIGNSAGDLKLQADVQGDVVLFGDTDVGDEESGQTLYIHRKAAEGDSYMFFHTNSFGNAKWYSSSNMVMDCNGALALQSNAEGNVYYFENAAIGENREIRQDGYITVAGAARYVKWQVNDTTDNFELSREDSNIGFFDIQMPTLIDGGLTVGSNTDAGDNNLRVEGTGYFVGALTAASYADNTPFYEGDALLDLKGIKGEDGKINHASLPEFAQINTGQMIITIISGERVLVAEKDAFEEYEDIKIVQIKDDNGEPIMSKIDISYDIKDGQAIQVETPVYETEEIHTTKKRLKDDVKFDSKTGELYTQAETTTETQEDKPGRNLGAMISILTKAVQQLTIKVEALELNQSK